MKADLNHRYQELQAQIELLDREIGIAITEHQNVDHRNTLLNVLAIMLHQAQLELEMVTNALLGVSNVKSLIPIN